MHTCAKCGELVWTPGAAACRELVAFKLRKAHARLAAAVNRELMPAAKRSAR